MKDWTWPAVAAFAILVAAIVILFALTDDKPTRDRLISYFDAIVAFVVGAAGGAAVGWNRGLMKGKGLL